VAHGLAIGSAIHRIFRRRRVVLAVIGVLMAAVSVTLIAHLRGDGDTQGSYHPAMTRPAANALTNTLERDHRWSCYRSNLKGYQQIERCFLRQKTGKRILTGKLTLLFDSAEARNVAMVKAEVPAVGDEAAIGTKTVESTRRDITEIIGDTMFEGSGEEFRAAETTQQQSTPRTIPTRLKSGFALNLDADTLRLLDMSAGSHPFSESFEPKALPPPDYMVAALRDEGFTCELNHALMHRNYVGPPAIECEGSVSGVDVSARLINPGSWRFTVNWPATSTNKESKEIPKPGRVVTTLLTSFPKSELDLGHYAWIDDAGRDFIESQPRVGEQGDFAGLTIRVDPHQRSHIRRRESYSVNIGEIRSTSRYLTGSSAAAWWSRGR